MAAISSLTERCIYLERGKLLMDDSTEAAMKRYTASWSTGGLDKAQHRLHVGTHSQIELAELLDADGQPTNYYVPGDPLRLRVGVRTDGQPNLSLDVMLVSANSEKIALGSLGHFERRLLPVNAGSYIYELTFNSLWLASGAYVFDVFTSIINQNWDDYLEAAIGFEVAFSSPNRSSLDFKQSYGLGVLALLCTEPIRELGPAARD